MLVAPLRSWFSGMGGFTYIIIIINNIWVLTMCRAPFKAHCLSESSQGYYEIGTAYFYVTFIAGKIET